MDVLPLLLFSLPARRVRACTYASRRGAKKVRKLLAAGPPVAGYLAVCQLHADMHTCTHARSVKEKEKENGEKENREKMRHLSIIFILLFIMGRNY